MSFDFQKRALSLYMSRKFQENILDHYQSAWDVNNESAITSCEQKLIKLDKKTLVGYLQQFVINQSQSWELESFIKQTFVKQTGNKYASCVLHLTHAFCIPGQEEKIKVVQVELNKVLQYCTEEERYDIFERYISQQLKAKPNLIEIDLLTGQIDPHHEFLLKLCYWDIVCSKRNNECCQKFLQQNVVYLVSNIERSFQVKNLEKDKIKIISCTMLLCLLNWNICKIQTPGTHQNLEAPASSSDAMVADTSTNNYSCTAHKVSNILHTVWSTLSKDDIYTVFNNYSNKMSAMKSDITEGDFCTDKIEPYFEFILKLCYLDYLCIKNDYKRCYEFLRRNADLFVSQIEEVVHGDKTKTKHKSCKVLLCLLNWNICDQISTLTQSKIHNSKILAPPSFQSEEEGTTKNPCTVYKVRCVLKNLLSTLTKDDIAQVFNGYIEQMYAMKSEITPDGLCIGEAELHHEFKLKLFYWRTICRKNDYEAYKKFIQLYPEFLVLYIGEVVQQNETKSKISSCKTLLCILNWNICHQKKVKISTKYQCTTYKVRILLQKLLSTLSEDEIISAFNDYIEQMNTMKSEIIEDDFCTGKIDPYHEFMMKLCYCEKLCDTIDDFEPYKEFLRKNFDLFVPQIQKVVHGDNTEIKHKSCKILLCLLNWNICYQKTPFIRLKIQNSEIQQSCTMYHVRCVLENLLSTLTDDGICAVINGYIDQMYEMKSEITPDGLCIGVAELHHEFKLKLCYWRTICRGNNKEAYKKFIQLYPEFLVSHIKKEVVQIKLETKTKLFFCKTLLCILNWTICNLKTVPILVQNTEMQASKANVEDLSTNKVCNSQKIWSLLKTILSTLSENEIFTAFNNYLDQMYAMQSEIKEDDFCTGKMEPFREFQLKLCYCEKLCNKNDDEAYKEFLRRNADMLVSQIERLSLGRNLTKTKLFACKTLLCLLKWNICDQKTNLITMKIKDCKIKGTSSFTLEEEKSTKCSTTVHKLMSVLHILFSNLSENEIFTAFNDNFDQILTMNSEIIEDDFCTDKIEPIHKFQLWLCCSGKLCHKEDEETYRNFLRRNADFLVLQLIKVVDSNETKSKLISCKVLMCLLKWDICSQEIAYTSLKFILSRMLTKEADYKKFMNENAVFFVSMVDTVMTRHNIPVLIELCDVLFCITYNECHFHDVTGAVNKLIRFYATQVGLNKKILEWILELGYRYLKNLNDYQKQDSAGKIKTDFMKFCNLLEDLFSDSMPERKTLNLVINAFRNNYDCANQVCNHENVKYCPKQEQNVIRLKKLWIDKFTGKVKAIQISNNIRNKGEEVSVHNLKDLIPMKVLHSTRNKINFIDEWEADLKEDQLDAKKIEAQLITISMAEEMVKKWKLSEMLVLLMMLLMMGTSTGHHKSAKLKKYLTLKYEYHKASLYLLWCSGDIEVHPGPSQNKKLLDHASTIERRWIPNVSQKLNKKLKQSGKLTKCKSTQMRNNDDENREHFKTLLKVGKEENLHVQKLYQAEINAWDTKKYQVLNKLFLFRDEIEIIIASIKDFLTCEGTTEAITYINVNLITELKTNEIVRVLEEYVGPEDKSQNMVKIIRKIAVISNKCARGLDPAAKWDGIWDQPLDKWPSDILLFDPNNRGKYKKKYPGRTLVSDKVLVDTFLTLPQISFPQKYTGIVNAYKLMRKNANKQHKENLCSIFKRTTGFINIDYALKNLYKNGIFTKEVHDILHKWWNIQTVETNDDEILIQVNNGEIEKEKRPHILINISTKSITLTVEQSDANSSQVSYDFPFKDELVPIKTIPTTVHQTTIQKPSSDSYQMVTAKKYTVSSKQDACPVDNQTYSIIIPPLDLNPNSQAILESDIKHQQNISTEETALCSTIDFDQLTSSTKQISQLNQTIATPNQSTTNSDDTSSATKNSQSLDFHTHVSPTSDIGSSDSISSVNSESRNDDGDQNNISNGGQVLLTDSDYSSNSSNNCVSKTNKQKRKFTEEDRNGMKKRKIPSQEDKKPIETNHRQMDCLMDNTAAFNKNREILPDWLLDIDLDSYDIENQTFKVDQNALDNEDTELVKFLQDMINCESEKNVTNEII
ncbi:Hypothetical predicted protein [Mytilus galloprovincialis]|uniref:Uncharacterized protein n=1 Tax=Mytilus galloprovincialis TaxID=29158 RepID=A0A8B6H4S9_MYTGA|nr:Hypothetical predicted protein [Mytilus galloprovincialis]